MLQVTQSPFGTAHATAGPQATGGITIDGKTGTGSRTASTTPATNDAVFTCFVHGPQRRSRSG